MENILHKLHFQSNTTHPTNMCSLTYWVVWFTTKFAEAYLGPYETFVMELYYENSQFALSNHCFDKNVPSQMFDRVQNTSLCQKITATLRII